MKSIVSWASGAVLALILSMSAVPASAQVFTGTVSGTIKDAQGGVIPGVTVVLLNEAQGTHGAPAVTNENGDFVIPGVPGGTYTVEVSMTGFKALKRSGVAVTGGDRVTVGVLTLEVGGTSEVVDVKAEAPLLQAASGERSVALNTDDAASLPTLTRAYRDLANLMVGVNPAGAQTGQGRLGGGGMDNIMMDGISIMDTGSNGLMGGLNIPTDQIAEVKIVTSSYQAEFGRSSGLQISAVTKSGTNQFHGTLYYVKRNSKWNANTWANLQNGVAKTVVNQTDWGYTIGGPVGKPRGQNRLFFFYGQEFQPRSSSGATNNFRLPTALERQGDFSATLDNNGNPFPYIKDPLSSNPCATTATGVHTGCFADGGVLGKIPVSRLYGPGMALLNQYPLPQFTQAAGTNFNYQSVQPSSDTMTYFPTIRADYQVNDRLRVSGKFTGRAVPKVTNYGTLPGYTDQIPLHVWVNTISATANYRLTPTMFLEVDYGTAQNALGNTNTSPYANRNNVNCPTSLSASVANCTLGALSFVFPNQPINPAYYAANILAGSQDLGPDGAWVLPPRLAWSATGTTSRVGNPPPSINFPGCANYNRTQDVSANLTRLMGRHTAKVGLYVNHSYKVQSPTISLSPNGNLNFGNDSNNPLDSQFPFANAALGVFSSYGQVANYVEGKFIYNNVEFYLQDNWKMTSRLTLDYGMRFVHQTPQYDNLGQTTNFFPDQWTRSTAPLLYVSGCPGGAVTCASGARQAKNPGTGQLLGTGTASLIGLTIPGSGNFADGIVQAGHGIPLSGYNYPAMGYAPRVGGAYDLNGNQKIVLRGAFGLFFDRPDGHRSFTTITNPPVVSTSTIQWGQLTQLGNPQFPVGAVPNLFVNQYNSPLPADAQWNGGVQIALPWSSSLDVAYVGHHAYNILNNGDNQAVNINTIDLGTTFKSSSLDPTQTAAVVLPDNLLRAYRGYGSIQINTGAFYRTYHSIQTTFNRRFRNGISFNVAWTMGLSDKGTQNPPGGNPVIRYDHNADGTVTVRADQATAEALFADQGLTRHIITSTAVWTLPKMKTDNSTTRIIGAVANDWQVSAIWKVDSGAPYDATFSYSGGGGVALTGSSDYTARILTNGTPTGGCSSNQYKQFDTSIYSGPQVGSVGLDSGRFTGLHSCGNHIVDMAITRSIRLGGNRSLQFRVDLTNAFNMVIYTLNAASMNAQWTSPTNQGTILNSQYNPDGTLNQSKLKPQSAGFGAASGAMGPRNTQVQVRFAF